MSDSDREALAGRTEVRAIARLAALDLSDDRLEAVLGRMPGVEREHGALRELPLDLESHVVFDPRWD